MCSKAYTRERHYAGGVRQLKSCSKPPESPVNDISLVEAVETDVLVTTKAVRLSRSPIVDYNAVALNFFLRHYVRSSSAESAQHSLGFVGQLADALPAVRHDSPLYHAVSAVAIIIARLWSHRDANSSIALSEYCKATASLQKALKEPDAMYSDYLLLAVLVLDLFEKLNTRFTGRQAQSLHRFGAYSIILTRGDANFKNNSSISMLIAIRQSVLHYSLRNVQALPQGFSRSFCYPPTTTAGRPELDALCVLLLDYLLKIKDVASMEYFDRNFKSHDLIYEGHRLDESFTKWPRTLSCQDLPQILTENDIPASVRAAGAYRNRCAVYEDLGQCVIWNQYRQWYLIFLIHYLQCCDAQLDSMQNDTMLQRHNIQEKVQSLADGICETIPFLMGDCLQTTNPVDWKSITFPFIQKAGLVVPDPSTNYPQRAAAVGGWLAMPPLLTLVRYLKAEDSSLKLKLRKGQQKWIGEQLQRMHKVWNFGVPLL